MLKLTSPSKPYLRKAHSFILKETLTLRDKHSERTERKLKIILLIILL